MFACIKSCDANGQDNTMATVWSDSVGTEQWLCKVIWAQVSPEIRRGRVTARDMEKIAQAQAHKAKKT